MSLSENAEVRARRYTGDKQEQARVEDHLIETDERPAYDVAAEIFNLAGWGKDSSV